MKHFLGILLIFIIAGTMQAQVRLGPKVGFNVVLPKFDNDVGITLPTKTDINVGIFFSKDFSNGDKIQIEANYYTKVDIEFESSGSTIATIMDLGFISIPIQYGFKLGKTDFYVLAGVSVLFSIAWTEISDGDLNPVSDLILAGGSGEEEHAGGSFGLGGKIGAEYYFSKLSIVAYYEFPFFTDSNYTVNDSRLLFSNVGLSLYYNIIK
jgi:hypothetical protein